MALYTRPSSRGTEIDSLLDGVERYNPENASVLEDYLTQQIRDDTYDPLANLALLKLIQFNEHLVPIDDADDASPDTITLILAKTLVHAPVGPDFSQCLALIADRLTPIHSSQSQITSLRQAIQLSQLLKERSFQKFWSHANGLNDGFKSSLTALPNYKNVLRQSIAAIVTDTFKSIEVTRVKAWFDFENDGQVEEFVTSNLGGSGWQVVGPYIVVPSNEANDPKPAVQSETVDLSRMVRTLAQSIQV